MNEMPIGAANSYAQMLAGSGLNLSGQERLHRVSGIEGMNTFPTKPNSEYVLFEENSDIFCVKTSDQNNATNQRYFAFQEISKEEAMHEISPYVMKDDLKTFKDDIIDVLKQSINSFKEEILNGQQSVRNAAQKPNSNAASAIRTEAK